MPTRITSIELGPLLTITEEELSRPARRREDRDILVLRIEIEAQRREVARLMALAGERLRRDEPVTPNLNLTDPDKLLLSAKDLRKALGVSAGTLYRWMKEDKFPPQIHLGSLARWNKAEVEAWIEARAAERLRDDAIRNRPRTQKKVRGGRSRWASTAQPPVVTESNAPAWEARPEPLRGTGHRLPGGVPKPVAPSHPDYTVPRFSRQHAVDYLRLPWQRQFELDQIPHGRTNALHFCFAQSDLDALRATLPPPKEGRSKARGTKPD